MNKLGICLLFAVYGAAFKAAELAFKALWLISKTLAKLIVKMVKKGVNKLRVKKAIKNSLEETIPLQQENKLERSAVRSNNSQESRLNTRMAQAQERASLRGSQSSHSLATGHAR
ncbi:hypothetical protein [Candidatus Enterococcus mangumiae]|uniref:Uncharacterized protein n=1 Tax=Candidatus Enterococcus mangumiae TaxID=2230878 RepID=A0ABZ2SWX8_9ENTE|nr:hypothetical protein [Enterococcus sp. DIV1094]MBO0490902.1 hypothetical protein [Enterococcus sp. DIV1094]